MKDLSDKLVRVVRLAEAILSQVPETETSKPVLSGAGHASRSLDT